MHGIHRKYFWLRILCGMCTRFPHPPTDLNGPCSGLIIFRPSSNRTGLGGYPCLSNVSSVPSLLPDLLSCLRAHGRPTSIRTLPTRSNSSGSRWLLDHDRDADGMQVIADLHGGDPENASAKAEFQEIKDRVTFDVSTRGTCGQCGTLIPSPRSGHLARHALTGLCGRGINAEFCWQCPPRHSLNW